MDKIIKWMVVGYVMLLAFTAMTPIVGGEGSIEKVENEKSVGNEIGISNKEILPILSSESPQPLWHAPQHRSIARIAAEKSGWVEERYIQIMEDATEKPDDPYWRDPLWMPIAIAYGIPDAGTWNWDSSQQCKHAYFVNPVDRAVRNSRAHEMCQHYYNKAMNEFANGKPEEAFKYLGYATHYLQDVGNPMHTALAPMDNIASHIDYENHVDSNWCEYENFMSDAESVPVWYADFSSTPKQSVIDLATYSNGYADELFEAWFTIDTALFEEDRIQAWNKVNSITHKTITETTEYTIGFYEYVFDNLPDLTITSNISIDGYTSNEDANLTTGQSVSLSVDIKNRGGTVENIVVSFYNDILFEGEGTETTSSNEIGRVTIPKLNKNETQSAYVSGWSFCSPHVITVKVDPDDTIFEQYEDNNEMIEKLPDLTILVVDMDVSGDFYATIYNGGEDYAYNALVRFYEGGTYYPNEVYNCTITSISPSQTINVTYAYTSKIVVYELQVTVDQEISMNPRKRGEIGEIDEYNNKNEYISFIVDNEITLTDSQTYTESINIIPGGKLVLDKCIFNMDSDEDGKHIIRVCKGGELVVKDSTIQKTPTGKFFELIVYGNMIVENSNITGLYRGLWIYSDNVTITGSTIKDNNRRGILCSASSPIITKSTIDGGSKWEAIQCIQHSTPTITENTIIGRFGVVIYSFSSPIIRNNDIITDKEGIESDGAYPHIEGNNITSNIDSGTAVACYRSNAKIVKNNITNSAFGIYGFYSKLDIEENNIENCVSCIYFTSSNGNIKDNTLTIYESEGCFRATGVLCTAWSESGDPSVAEIVGNIISSDGATDNSFWVVGIYSGNSEVTIKDNIIYGFVSAYGDIIGGALVAYANGIWSVESTINITNTTILECNISVMAQDGEATILNSSFSSFDYDIITGDGAIISTINTTFDGEKVLPYGPYGEGTIIVKHYLDVYVKDLEDNPVPNASVTVKDEDNNNIHQGVTNPDGWIKDIICLHYTQNYTATITKADHTISVSKGAASDSTTITMDSNKQHTFTLNVQPDLTLNSSDITYTEKGIFATIWNIGDAYAVNASVKFFFDDNEIGNQVLSVVPPDEKNATALLLWRDVFFNPAGTHNIKVVVDSNEDTASLIIDITPTDMPTLQSPSNNSYVYNGIPIFQLTSTDPNSKNLTYRIQLSNDEFTTILYTFNQLNNITGWSKWIYNSSEVATYYLQNQEVLTEGIYYWRAQAFNGDVWCDISSYYTFTFDITNPATYYSLSGTMGDNDWYRSNVEVTLTATDNIAGVKEIRYQIDTEPEKVYTAPFTVSGDGTHTISYYSVDNAGNSETPETVTIKIDKTPPTSFVNTILPYWQTTSEITITATVYDDLSGIAGAELWYRYSFDNTTWGDWTWISTDTTSPWLWSFNFPSGNGYYHFYSRGRDNAGNYENAPGTADAICGYSLLTSQINSILPYWCNISPTIITGTANSGLFYVTSVELWYRYSTNNATWGDWTLFGTDTVSPWSWDFTFPNGEGYYRFYSRAQDSIGNYEVVPVTPIYAEAICGYDKTPPSTPTLILPEEGNRTWDRTPTFSWSSCTDSGPSGLWGYQLLIINLDTGAVDKEIFVVDSTSYTSSDPYFLNFHNYSWQVRARDYAGNYGNWSETRTITIYQIWGVFLTPHPVTQSVSPGDTANYIINIMNLGNDWDTFYVNITSNSSGWSAFLSTNYVSMDYWDSVSLCLNVTANTDYGTGHVAVMATSTSNTSCMHSIVVVTYIPVSPPEECPPATLVTGIDYEFGPFSGTLSLSVSLFCTTYAIATERTIDFDSPDFSSPQFRMMMERLRDRMPLLPSGYKDILPGILLPFYADVPIYTNLIEPGGTYTYQIVVTNPLNYTVTIYLTPFGVELDSWHAQLDVCEITLGPSENVSVNLTVTAPFQTDSYQATIILSGVIENAVPVNYAVVTATLSTWMNPIYLEHLQPAILSLQTLINTDQNNTVLMSALMELNNSIKYAMGPQTLEQAFNSAYRAIKYLEGISENNQGVQDVIDGIVYAVNVASQRALAFMEYQSIKDPVYICRGVEWYDTGVNDVSPGIAVKHFTLAYIFAVGHNVEDYYSFDTCISPEVQIIPGETANYTVTVNNIGLLDDTYNLLLLTDMDSSWINFPLGCVDVPADSSTTLLLQFTPSADLALMYNTTYTFEILAMSVYAINIDDIALTESVCNSLTVIATKESKTRYMINEVEELMIVLDSMDIQAGVKNSLKSKLENALDKLNTALDDILNGDENHANNMLNCAQNKINAFINEVEAQRGKKISDEDADTLVSTAQTIIEHINDTMATPF